MRTERARYEHIEVDTDCDASCSDFDSESHVSLGDTTNKHDNLDDIFTFKDIKYSIKGSEILHGVSGHVMKGQLVAILGHSGAGKTTLLNALSGRQNTGKLSGEICHNGEKVTNIQRLNEMCGYVTQNNLLYPTATAKESIEFAAKLRLPQYISDKVKQQSIDSVISALKLKHCENRQNSTAFKSGLSGGEAKRVSIGIELITNPQLLFLDEPVSGLDSYTSLQTIKILKNLTENHQKQILLTIHQPSAEIFSMFDKVILMSNGHCVYFGAPTDLSQYFKLLGYNCPKIRNFADFVIHSIQEDPEFFISAWEKFQFDPIYGYTENYNLPSINSSKQTNETTEVIKRDGKCTSFCNNLPIAPFWRQLWYLMVRDIVGIYRNPVPMLARNFNTILMSAVVTLIYFHIPDTMRGAQDLNTFLFFICTHAFVSGLCNAFNFIVDTRIIMEHERKARTYSVTAFLLSKLMLSSTICLIETFLVAFMTSYGVLYSSWSWSLVRQFHVILFLMASTSSGFGALTATQCKSMAEAMWVPAMFTPIMLFNNLTADMTRTSSWISWIRYINFQSYGMECIYHAAFYNRTIKMNALVTITGEQYLDYLNVGTESFTYNIGMVAMFACMFWFVTWSVLVNRCGC